MICQDHLVTTETKLGYWLPRLSFMKKVATTLLLQKWMKYTTMHVSRILLYCNNSISRSQLNYCCQHAATTKTILRCKLCKAVIIIRETESINKIKRNSCWMLGCHANNIIHIYYILQWGKRTANEVQSVNMVTATTVNWSSMEIKSQTIKQATTY